MFRNIWKLMPGHILTLDLQDEVPAPRIYRYWDLPEQNPDTGHSEAELIAECRRRLEESVRMRMMSDVPLGVFLSGGLDSSAIAAIMQQCSGDPINTFSVGYDEAAYSELGYADTVAKNLGTHHHQITITRDQFFSSLPRVIWHEDEPAVFSSSVPLYFVSKLASEHVKVVLGGEGSDELFAGYERYRYYSLNRSLAKGYGMVPKSLRELVRSKIDNTSLLSGDLRRKLRHTVVGREDTFEALQLENFYSAFSRSEIKAALRGPNSLQEPFNNVLGFWRAREHSPTLLRMLYTDQKTYLLELLMRQDQMSMAWSIESRVPFLDHTFVEFAMRVPDRLKIRGRRGKAHSEKELWKDCSQERSFTGRKWASLRRCGDGFRSLNPDLFWIPCSERTVFWTVSLTSDRWAHF